MEDKRTAMLVSGNINLIATLKGYIKYYNLDTIAVDNAKEAIALICDSKTRLDVILIDLSVHNALDGLDIISRANKCRSKIPVIAISSFSEDKIIKEAISKGVKDYLVMPISSSRLHNVIDGLFKGLMTC